MRFSWTKLLLVALLSLGCNLPWQKAQAERIRDFQADLVLSESGLLNVTETIRYDFEKAHPKALYRLIPLQYLNPDQGPTRISEGASSNNHDKLVKPTILPLSVRDGSKDVPINCKISGGFASLQIADGKKMLSGKHTFRIEYAANHAVNFHSQGPELFWSCFGKALSIPVDNVRVVLHCPAKITMADLVPFACNGRGAARQPGKIIGNTLQFSGKNLKAGQDFCCVVSFPTKAITPPSPVDNFSIALLNWKTSLCFPAVTFVLLFIVWLISGRDSGNGQKACAWMPPTDLTPAELGTLSDEHCDKSDITLTLLDLAARGYLIITEVPYRGLIGRDNKDYQFKKAASPDPERLKPHEVLLLSSLFVANPTTHLSTLRGQYAEQLGDMRRLIYQSLVKEHYFARLPQGDREAFIVVGSIVLGVGAVLLVTGVLNGGAYKDYGMGFALSGLMIIVASVVMPKRTGKGVASLRQAEAFRHFVKGADPLQFKQIARENPSAFGRFLPYAFVLGCADKWAENFKDHIETGPDYFRESTGSGGSEESLGNLFDSQAYVAGVARAMSAINLAIDSRFIN